MTKGRYEADLPLPGSINVPLNDFSGSTAEMAAKSHFPSYDVDPLLPLRHILELLGIGLSPMHISLPKADRLYLLRYVSALRVQQPRGRYYSRRSNHWQLLQQGDETAQRRAT